MIISIVFRYFIIAICFMVSVNAGAAINIVHSQVNLTGTVVSSSCSIVVEDQEGKSRSINLGVYNQAVKQEGQIKRFLIKLYSDNASQVGCDAFGAGDSYVKFTFGDKTVKQLDSQGIITKGAGDNIHLLLWSTDNSFVSSTEPLTESHNSLFYPKDFAAKGIFSFNVKAIGLDRAKTGSYHGELSVVVSYQ